MGKSEQYIHRCSRCGLSREEFHIRIGRVDTSGLFAKHRHLCLGKSDSGKLLHHNQCLICDKSLEAKSISALYKHYTRDHKQEISEAHSILEIHRDFQPHEYPDLDFNQDYGHILTRQNVFRADEKIRKYWQTYIETPALISHEKRDIRDHYREAFFGFFGVDPISLHSHVSDAANPLVLTSLLLHLKECFPGKMIPLKVGRAARVAVMEGFYGMGFGPLAYQAPCSWSSAVACGPKPFYVNVHSNNIQQQVKIAKAKKCVAFLVSIVSSNDGSVMSTIEWQEIIEACKKYHMPLVVDEAMTAIRCGAPFAHQLPEYKHHGRPDLILFGKGIRTCGVAVDWQGVNLQQLGHVSLEERIEAIVLWGNRFTEIATPVTLLESWGVITLARKQEWPQRAWKIGQVLRRILGGFGMKDSSISGLHSLLWLSRHDRAIDRLAVMSANAGEEYTRWLPLMDSVMTSDKEMETKVFGLGSRAHRKMVAAYLIEKGWGLGYCPICGEAVEIGDDRVGVREKCMVCFTRPCDYCEPGDHVCPLMDTSEGA